MHHSNRCTKAIGTVQCALAHPAACVVCVRVGSYRGRDVRRRGMHRKSLSPPPSQWEDAAACWSAPALSSSRLGTGAGGVGGPPTLTVPAGPPGHIVGGAGLLCVGTSHDVTELHKHR